MTDNTHERSITIFDTTLRDGEQTPGVGLDPEEKLTIARQLERLQVDVIEAGFPATSPGDFEAVQRIASDVQGPAVAGLARAQHGDVEACARALEPAAHPRIHVVIATSPVHRERKLEMTGEQVIDAAVDAVEYARGFSDDVEFSAEDASRTPPEFLERVLEAVIEAGATTVNVPDTVGYAMPEPFGERIARIQQNVRGIENVATSVHCHDDLGLATANTLSAVRQGATQVEVAVNGIGERGGNASLEEVVMAIELRGEYLGCSVGVDPREITRTSRMVSSLTGVPVQPNKAVVGENAFAHESGIHQHGVIKERSTYEIMRPRDVGRTSNRLVLGKHSGRHALAQRLRELGHDLSPEALDEVFRRFKRRADRSGNIGDEELESILPRRVE